MLRSLAVAALAVTVAAGIPLRPSSSHASTSASAKAASAPILADEYDKTPVSQETQAPVTATLATVACIGSRAAGDYVEEVANGHGRTYRLHVPPSAGEGPLPLVLNFHGSGRTAFDQETYSGLAPLADAEGFVLVSPEGSGSPSGWDIPGVYHEIGVDDVAFVEQLLAQLEEELCIDTARVYATGLSNGAQMASQLACVLPTTFAGVAAVAGVVHQGCDGAPVPLIAFHGTADGNIPFYWPAGAAAQWAAHNGCGWSFDEAVAERVTVRVWAECSADVVFYFIEGGGHTWPGAEDDAGGVGFTTHEINASQLIWRFFASHARR